MLLRRSATRARPSAAGVLCAAVVALTVPLALPAQTAHGVPAAQAPATTSAARATARHTGRLTIDIKGMYCASCEQTVRAMLMRTPGVQSAAVQAKDGRALVTYDRAKATPASILAVVTRLGYEARIHEAGRTGADAIRLERP